MTLQIQLLEAARYGDVNEVRRLVEREKVDPNYQQTHSDGKTGRLWFWKKGFTPLHWATSGNHLHVVQYLVEGAQVDAEIRDDRGRTALSVACCPVVDASAALVRCLVEAARSSVNYQDKDRLTPLHHALTAVNQRLDVIQCLVDQGGAKLDVENKFGDTALSISFDSRNESLIRYFLSRIESVNYKVLLKSRVWSDDFPWDVKEMVLRKFAVRCRLVGVFDELPLHTIFRCFPLPSEEAFHECVENFPLATLSRLDHQGRLPIHGVLTSVHNTIKWSRVVSSLARRSPKSSLCKDPTTGLFPFEATALLIPVVGNGHDGDYGWLNAVYVLFRFHPVHFLCARGLMAARHSKNL